MKTLSTIALLMLLAGCASSFERFEANKQTCRDQGKKLLYNTNTFESYGCMTEDEFQQFQAARAAQPRASADAEAISSALIVQGYMQNGGLPWMQPAPAYNPAPMPPFQRSLNCIHNGPYTTCN